MPDVVPTLSDLGAPESMTCSRGGNIPTCLRFCPVVTCDVNFGVCPDLPKWVSIGKGQVTNVLVVNGKCTHPVMRQKRSLWGTGPHALLAARPRSPIVCSQIGDIDARRLHEP